MTRLPVSKSRANSVPPVNLRFKHASVAAIASCGGASGFISYYRFPSTKARAEAVRRSEGLISNELFCVDGPELVVNDLLGHDSTAPFCKRLGFKIHRPTRRYSPAQKLEHGLEHRAASLVGHATGVPTTNLFCRQHGGVFKLECQNMIGAEITEVELVKKDGRYVIKSRPQSRQP